MLGRALSFRRPGLPNVCRPIQKRSSLFRRFLPISSIACAASFLCFPHVAIVPQLLLEAPGLSKATNKNDANGERAERPRYGEGDGKGP
mmetsp:Transcript_24922/g.57504  ORF Transcript_24922/g.57504 Transcript_24922/m.57504 type:complete len:89 (-) Transcript_24922:844-1110(-)